MSTLLTSKLLIKRNQTSFLLYYVKLCYTVITINIGEYFRLHFITVVVAVFISIFHFFSLYFVFRDTLFNLYYFCCSSLKNSSAKNKACLVLLLLTLKYIYTGCFLVLLTFLTCTREYGVGVFSRIYRWLLSLFSLHLFQWHNQVLLGCSNGHLVTIFDQICKFILEKSFF